VIIFQLFEHLAPGNSLQLVVDHDPKPLRFQLEARHGSGCDWSYLEEGPDVWLDRTTLQGWVLSRGGPRRNEVSLRFAKCLIGCHGAERIEMKFAAASGNVNHRWGISVLEARTSRVLEEERLSC